MKKRCSISSGEERRFLSGQRYRKRLSVVVDIFSEHVIYPKTNSGDYPPSWF
jgi:hypothetical protein